jgi:hypothetical protein
MFDYSHSRIYQAISFKEPAQNGRDIKRAA